MIAVIFVSNLLAGLWPALQATKRDVNELIKSGTGGTARLHSGWLPSLIVMVQIAFSVVVLTQSFVLVGFSEHIDR